MHKRTKLTMAAISFGILTAFGFPAIAQGTATAPQGATAQAPAKKHEGFGKLLKDLNLTAAQKTQIKSIMKATREQVRAVKADTKLTTDAKKEQIKTDHKEAKKQIMALLTPEQKAKLKQLHHEEKAQK